MSADEWISTKEAARRLEISRRSVVDRINKGKLRARRDGKLWLVHSSLLPPSEEDQGNLTATERQLSATVDILREQLEIKDRQIERDQVIILQLTRDIESQQKLIEYQHVPFWRKWFKKGQT
jgi:excisionase family DNA binding protein